MNAVVMAHGLVEGGPVQAQASLEAFWKRVSDAARLSPMRRGPIEILSGRWSLEHSPMYLAADLAARMISPYDLILGGENPLRQILLDSVNFERLTEVPISLFVTATSVRTGLARVFRNAELSPDVLLASACLPTMFKAVEIDGDSYWDGGYSGNPSMGPLVRECASRDIVLVQINPIERAEVPRSAREIQSRLNEISFNSPLIKELRMGALLRRATDPGTGEGSKWAKMRIHRISSEAMLELESSSKVIAEWAFLCMLRDEGRRAASTFLDNHGADLGVRSTLDLDSLLEAT
jgi:NTE family protein